jgi:hypothetical protein
LYINPDGVLLQETTNTLNLVLLLMVFVFAAVLQRFPTATLVKD